MTELERYIFDTSGVLIRRNVVPEAELAVARELIFNQISKAAWKFPILDLGDVFWNWLVKDEFVQPAIEMCGDYTRLDHAFGVSGAQAASAPAQLHGGPDSSQGSCFYHNTGGPVGLVGQLSAGVCLSGQDENTGGFCYLPGSHKAQLRIDGKQIYLNYFKQQLKHDAVVVPRLKPGDLIYFSESLVHGDTGAWQPHSRLMAYYKFTPGWMCWRDPVQQARYLNWIPSTLTSAQHQLVTRLLEPPWTGRFDDTNGELSRANERRKQTNA